MARTFIPINAVVEATSCYVGTGNDRTCIGNDVKVALPEVTPTTVDVTGMLGTVSIPLTSSLEDMETTIAPRGVDKATVNLSSPGKKQVECRWVQETVKSDGTTAAVGCKAEMTCVSKTYAPGTELEPGGESESEVTLGVLAYTLTVDGVVLLNINRMTGVFQAISNGKLTDFTSQINNLL